MAADVWGRGAPDGDTFGQSGKTMSFYGGTTVAQPTGNAQAALTRGQNGGAIATYSSTQSPAIVNTITTGERTMTVQTGTGFAMQIATTDLVYVNKPTSQAGLGVGNVRASAANQVAVTFNNPSAGNITPTASEVYGIVALRGLSSTALTISPAAVLANTTVEQQFTCTGLRVGELVQVSKPTSQAGLDIVGCRVVSNNLLGITFMNCTAGNITPTASEIYTVWSLNGLDALNNHVNFGFNVGTVGAITAGVVVSGGSTTLTGILATDSVVGIFKPTPQAAATNVATPIYGIPTANTLTLHFLGTGTGATPTASEVYTISVLRLNPVAPLLLYSTSLAPVSVAANTTAEQTFTVTGLISGTPVWVNKPSAQAGLGIAGVRVSATSTLAINYTNTSATAIVPTTETYTIGNFQVPLPGAGNCVWQAVSAADHQVKNLAAALRAALIPTTGLNLIAGA